RERHYHQDYRLPKDEIRDYPFDPGRNLETFSRDISDKYRDKYNEYVSILDNPYRGHVSEDYCDNRSTDARSYTERRKKTVRFNSEGWDTLDDFDTGVDQRWTSVSNVYYDEDKETLPIPLSSGIPLEGIHAQRRKDITSTTATTTDTPFIKRDLSWTARELPLPAVRKELWEVERQESQDSQTKDSGIDSGTSSNFNSSEDSSKGDVSRSYRHPVSWQPSQDGTRMIGHMILSKHLKGEIGPSSSATILGLKVGGGKILDSGKIGALIEKVKKGSIADTVGHLRPGDEVLEWNGRSLQGKTYEEVYDIIAESRHEPQVELIVSRQLSDVGRQPGRRHTHSGIGSRTLPEPGVDPRKLSEPVRDRRPSVTITSPGSPEAYGTKDHSPSISGRL
ncbi:Regulating synaptic membrane exocytosis protein 2, partial [Armadillidium nasatum]